MLLQLTLLTTPTSLLVKTSLNALQNLTLAKKSLVNDKVTVPCPTRYASYAHYIHHSKQQNELEKLIRPTIFQNLQMQSVSIFFRFVHLHLSFVFALLFILSGLCSSIVWWPPVPNITFALGQLENLTLFIQIIRWAP